jgi:hypothetical protein
MNMTREQARRLSELMQPRVGYIVRIRERMDRRGMQNDPLFKLLVKAEDALLHFTSVLHYRSCEMGVGRTADDEQEPKGSMPLAPAKPMLPPPSDRQP